MCLGIFVMFDVLLDIQVSSLGCVSWISYDDLDAAAAYLQETAR